MNAVKEPVKTLYETDFAAWAFEQAEAVKRGDWRAVDVPHLVEELESMGKQQRAELVNRLSVLLMHLIKWQYQPMLREHKERSWLATIAEQRFRIERHIEDSPSLKPFVPEAIERAWRSGRFEAGKETGLDPAVFPTVCPYAWEQIMNMEWLPPDSSR
jgi:hypothetical protein